MDNQKNNMVTIHINGCTVTVPAEQEQLYREVLADKWIDGHRIYVKDGKVYHELDPKKHTMNPQTMIDILIEENDKRYALAGKY